MTDGDTEYWVGRAAGGRTRKLHPDPDCPKLNPEYATPTTRENHPHKEICADCSGEEYQEYSPPSDSLERLEEMNTDEFDALLNGGGRA